MKHTTYHHKNLRNELIEKGIELVEEYGMQQLSLRKVAQACNVSHAAPYSHFKNKDDLISAMQLYYRSVYGTIAGCDCEVFRKT